jgi:putative ABC transport system ATP-binding protein
MTGERPLLEIRGLTVCFTRWNQTISALDGIDVEVPSGQWIVLVGHNGSGKTTLLNAIDGRISPKTGEIRIRGLQDLSPSQIVDNVFHVHQDPLLGTAPILTVFENLFVADDQAFRDRVAKNKLVKKYQDLLRPVGLSDRIYQPAKLLSGGERQLLALLIARLRPSALMLLDEPLAALDPGKAELCQKLIRGLSQEGRTIIQVTHEPDIAVSEGQRTLVLRQGKIVYDVSGEQRNIDDIQACWASPY